MAHRLRIRILLVTGRSLSHYRPMKFQRRPTLHEGNIPVSRVARILLGLGVCGYVASYLVWTIHNFDGFGTYGFDFGIHDQAVWLLSQGDFNPFITLSGSTYFGDHLSWIMYFLVPFYWIFGSSKVLLVAQALALGTAAVPAFLVARKKLGSEWLACGIAWVYLLNPYIGWANLEQFHPDVFEVVLVFMAFLFVLQRRWKHFLAVIVLMMLVKEDVPLLVLGIGVWVAVLHNRMAGIIATALSAVWLFVNFRLLLPALGGTGSLAGYVTMHANRVPFGGISGLLRTFFTKPWKVVAAMVSEGRAYYYLQVLAPTAFLPFLSPSTFLAVILPLVANGLSTFWYQHSIHYHYGTLVVPGLIVAAVWGIAHGSKVSRRIMVGFMLVLAAVGLWLWGPVPGSLSQGYWARMPIEFSQAVGEAIQLIPEDAVVSADYHLVTQIDHRREIYEFPNPWIRVNWNNRAETDQELEQRAARVQYVLVLSQLESKSAEAYEEIMDSGDFVMIFNQEGVVLLRRSQ
jgi:uncharacterized membrane protein